MSSGGGSEDSYCPSCGGKVSPTSPYCMHCHSDLDRTVSDPDLATGDSDEDQWGTDSSSDATDTHETGTRPEETSTGETTPGQRQAPKSDVEADSWKRILTALFVSIPVGLLSTLILLVAFIPYWPVALVGGFLAWVGTVVKLGAKPLPSDILGDAAYLVGGLFVLFPVVGGIRYALGGSGLDDALGLIIVGGIFAGIPAVIIVVIGYVANSWAEAKLDPNEEFVEM